MGEYWGGGGGGGRGDGAVNGGYQNRINSWGLGKKSSIAYSSLTPSGRFSKTSFMLLRIDLDTLLKNDNV